MFAPVGSVTINPPIFDVLLQPGFAMSQQLHCVDTLMPGDENIQPPARKKKLATLVEAWLVIPLADADDEIVPEPSVPGMRIPDVVEVEVPPRGDSGQVSPAVMVVGVPFVVKTAFIPVARPLN